MQANPSLNFAYEGTTSQVPGTVPEPGLRDGANVIGWALPLDPHALAQATVWVSRRTGMEADIALNPIYPWAWTPCGQRDGSCRQTPPWTEIEFAGETVLVVGDPAFDIQAVATHELGHWLSLEDLRADLARNLTMYQGALPGAIGEGRPWVWETSWASALYSCGSCTKPEIHIP